MKERDIINATLAALDVRVHYDGILHGNTKSFLCQGDMLLEGPRVVQACGENCDAVVEDLRRALRSLGARTVETYLYAGPYGGVDGFIVRRVI